MPLIAAAFVAHAAGLLLGFGGFSLLGIFGAGALTAAGVMRRDVRVAALGLLGVGGVLRADLASAADSRCAQAASAGATVDGERALLTGTIEEDARPGVRARAVIRDGGCQMRASVMVATGRANAGASVAIRGEAMRTGGIVTVQGATVLSREEPDLMRRWRERAGRAIDATFKGNDAALARALLIADTRTLDAGIRSRYADAGIVHLLSVSGLHVAIIAGAVELLLSAARVSRNAATWLSLAMTAVYVAVIGAPAPAVRSAMMLGATALSRLTQRPTSPWASLALGAWAPLVNPRIIADLGYQLSVVGIAGLIAAGGLTKRVLSDDVTGWRRSLSRDLIASGIAGIVTLPLLGWTFGRISLIAPLANLAAGPIFTVLQPTLFLALVLAPMPSVAAVPADAAHVFLQAVDVVANVATRVPYAAVPVAPSLWTCFLLGVIATGVVVACSSPPGSVWVARGLIAGATALAISVLGIRGATGGLVEMHMIDVGQGDAFALRTPRGRWILFDAGRSWTGGDAGRTTVIPYLRRYGGPLHAIVLSHAHSDHVGGVASVINALDPDEYWDPAYVAGSSIYRSSLQEAARSRVAWRRVHPGDSIVIDDVRVRFVAPDSVWTRSLDDANDASAVALVQYGRIRFLMTGDAELGEEAWLLERGTDIRADVLKVGHHGSSTSSSQAFLDAVRPRVALVSVGTDNSYGHPSNDVIRSLVGSGAQVLRSDQLGSVVVRTDGRSITINAGGEQWVR